MKSKSFFGITVFFYVIIVFLASKQSLWLDEAVTAVVMRDYSWSGLLTRFLPTDFHPVIYYSLLKVWTGVFGISEFSLRLPSLLFSLLSGYLLWRFWGYWAAYFFLFNPLVVYYSTEARMYSFSALLVVLIMLSYKLKRVWLYGLVIILSFNSFYGLVFYLAGLVIYLFWQRDWQWLGWTVMFSIIGLLIATPLLLVQLQHSRQMLGQVANWSQVLGTASLKNLLLIPLKFSIGRVSFGPKWLYYCVGLIWTGLVWFSLKWHDKRMILILIPIILAWGFSLFSPLLSYFRFLYLLPILAILFSAKKSSKVIKIVVILGFLGWSLVYVFNPLFHREDWRSLAMSLPKQAEVYGIVSSLEGINYYRSEVKRLEIRSQKPRAKQILVVPYTSDIHGFNYQAVLTRAGYQLKNQQSFNQLVLETWAR